MSPDWTQLAAMLTVMGICGTAFTWIVSMIIDKKMSTFEESMRRGFVNMEVWTLMREQSDEMHRRYESNFKEIFRRIESHGAGK